MKVTSAQRITNLSVWKVAFAKARDVYVYPVGTETWVKAPKRELWAEFKPYFKDGLPYDFVWQRKGSDAFFDTLYIPGGELYEETVDFDLDEDSSRITLLKELRRY